MKKVIATLFGIMLISAFAGTLYYLWSKTETTPVVYQTAEPSRTTIVKKTVATGSVVPRKEVEIKPQVTGIIDRMFVEPGDRVSAGDLVARIKIIPNMVSLNNAQNRRNMAQINLNNAEWEQERHRELRRDGAIPEAELKKVELAYRSAEEELAAAAENLQLIQKGTTGKAGGSSNTLVRATISGMVLEVPLEAGNSVIESNTFNDGTTIATIADMDELVFEGKVDESEVGKLRPGMDLVLTIGAIEDRQFEAKLEHIAPKGVEENGAIQFEIRAALEMDEDVFVRANLSANADIVLDRRDDVLAIDEALLQFDDEGTYVEVEGAPQEFEVRRIETGLSDGISIEILSGLTAGERIKNPTMGPRG